MCSQKKKTKNLKKKSRTHLQTTCEYEANGGGHDQFPTNEMEISHVTSIE